MSCSCSTAPEAWEAGRSWRPAGRRHGWSTPSARLTSSPCSRSITCRNSARPGPGPCPRDRPESVFRPAVPRQDQCPGRDRDGRTALAGGRTADRQESGSPETAGSGTARARCDPRAGNRRSGGQRGPDPPGARTRTGRHPRVHPGNRPRGQRGVPAAPRRAGSRPVRAGESENRLDEVMEAIHRQIGTPLLTDLALEPEGFTIEPDSLVPERLPDLFAGTRTGAGTVPGSARRPDGSAARAAAGLVWCQSLQGNSRDNPAIASAWARGQVRKLEDRYVVAAEDLGELSADRRALAPLWRAQPVHRVRRHQPRGDGQQGWQAAPDHSACRIAAGMVITGGCVGDVSNIPRSQRTGVSSAG